MKRRMLFVVVGFCHFAKSIRNSVCGEFKGPIHKLHEVFNLGLTLESPLSGNLYASKPCNNCRELNNATSLNKSTDGLLINKLSSVDFLLEETDSFTVDAITQRPELSFIGKMLESNHIMQSNTIFKRIAMTVFAPVDGVVSHMISFAQNKIGPYTFNEADIEGKLFMTHIIPSIIIDPRTISEKPLIFLTRSKQHIAIFIAHDSDLKSADYYFSQENNRTFWGSGSLEDSIKLGEVKSSDSTKNLDAEVGRLSQLRVACNGFITDVVGIIKTKRGYIYELNSILSYRWNPGPTVVNYVETTSGFAKVNFLMQHLDAQVRDKMARIGPVTLLLVKDSGWVFSNKQTVPDCFFDAIGAIENEEILIDLFFTVTIPGWNFYMMADIYEKLKSYLFHDVD